jgi:hypothetical protein
MRANPPSIVKILRPFRSGVFSNIPLKIIARKNTSKGKTLRTIGFVGGITRRTDWLHEVNAARALKPRLDATGPFIIWNNSANSLA